MNPAIRQISPRRQDDVHSRTENAVLSNSTETALPAALSAGRAEAVKTQSPRTNGAGQPPIADCDVERAGRA